jgi:undecaprenyl-diphosphatase
MRKNDALLPAALAGAGAGAAAGFAALTHAVTAHKTRRLDGIARKQFPKRRRRVTRALAEGLDPLGKPWGHGPAALGLAAFAWSRRGPHAAVPILASSVISAVASWLLEQTVPHRAPPPGRHSPAEHGFPSGHSLETSAVAWTTAYVLVRERLAPAAAAVPLAIGTPIAVGLASMYRDRHWLTDVLGGLLAGAVIAAPAAAGYELARPQRRSRRRKRRRVGR